MYSKDINITKTAEISNSVRGSVKSDDASYSDKGSSFIEDISLQLLKDLRCLEKIIAKGKSLSNFAFECDGLEYKKQNYELSVPEFTFILTNLTQKKVL